MFVGLKPLPSRYTPGSWGVLRPDLLALERRLGEDVVADVGQIEELFVPFLADVDAVAAAVVFLAERADELAGGVEDDDRVHDLPWRATDA